MQRPPSPAKTPEMPTDATGRWVTFGFCWELDKANKGVYEERAASGEEGETIRAGDAPTQDLGDALVPVAWHHLLVSS